MSGVECGLVCCRLVRFGGRLVGGVVADGDAPEVLVAVTDRERDGGEFDRSAVERACSGPSCGGLLRLDPADVADREAPPLGVVPVAVHRRGGYQPARDPVRGCLLGFEVWGEVAVIDPFEAEVLLESSRRSSAGRTGLRFTGSCPAPSSCEPVCMSYIASSIGMRPFHMQCPMRIQFYLSASRSTA